MTHNQILLLKPYFNPSQSIFLVAMAIKSVLRYGGATTHSLVPVQSARDPLLSFPSFVPKCDDNNQVPESQAVMNTIQPNVSRN